MKHNKRCTSLYVVLASLFLLEAVGLLCRSAVIPGAVKSADEIRELTERECDARTIASGDIYDCRGTRLVSCKEAGQYSSYADDFAYSQILGYALPLQNQYYRLMDYYREELFDPGEGEGRKGCDIYLTLDHNLQKKAFEILSRTVGQGGEGAVIIMEARTGELKAFVALPSFNANDLPESLKLMNDSRTLWYPVTYKKAVPPGSIFKIVSIAALLENGYEDCRIPDQKFEVDGRWITDAYQPDGRMIDYQEAFVRSSNIFMASAVLDMGGEKLTEMAKRFMIGEELELDFGTVKSNWELDPDNRLEVAQSAYGQGKILFSALHGAMMAQAVANNGVMMKPYMVEKIVAQDGRMKKEGCEEVLSEAVSAETAGRIADAMVAAGQSYGLSGQNRIAAKTGTAQIGDAENHYDAWIVSYAPADAPEYVVVINHCYTKEYGASLKKPLEELYQCLFGPEG